MDLNSVMETDHVIRVHDDGTVSEPAGEVWAPELHALSYEDGSHTAETDPDLCRQAADAGWALESGWTGQHGYNGPCMHASEFIGGGLATHILATPGYWVAVLVNEDDGDPESWAVAYRETI